VVIDKKSVVFLVKSYAVTVLLFLAAKVVFMLFNGSGHDAGVGDALAVLHHGLSLDLSTALYFLVVPLLACIAAIWVRVPKLMLKVYFAVVATAFALAFVADTSLYAFWGFKLDASCLQYLDQPEGITQSVSVGYLLLRLLALIACVLLIFFLYKKTMNGHPFSPTQGEPLKRKALRTTVGVLLMPLMVVGIRGGFSESTTNIGQVYFSQNQFLNHAAVNPVFSFLYSLSHQLGDLSQYDFMDNEQCRQLTSGVYTTESIDADTLLTTQRPNVVIILLESAGEQFANVMPRLQQLKQQGISFSRCYANSWRTDRGTLCTLSGYPSFPTLSVMKMPQKSRTLPAIARTLQQQGYATTYIYGGDINFTNMRSYLIATGWQRLVSMDDYSAAERGSAQWGVRDDITFQTLYHMLTDHTPTTQQLIGYSTLSSHEPWDVPTHTLADEVQNAFAYLDNCLADFVEQLRTTPAWDNLLIIITADHGINYKDIDQSRPLQKNHIPMLWIGGAVKEPRSIDAICNQSDLAATLLGQMGLPHSDFAFSRDVLSATYTHPVAVHNYNNAQWITDSTGHLLYDFDARRFVVNQSHSADSLLSVSKAMLQLTTHDVKQR
jgi:phosphoglycerol transferase MdoB-like AlkP superfamily enzyme